MARLGRAQPFPPLLGKFRFITGNLYIQTLDETLVLTDTVLRLPGRILTETLVITDTLLKTPGKVLTETLTLTDTLIRITGKVLTETLNLTDTLLKIPGRILSETLTLTDTILKTPGKVLSDTLTLSDVMTSVKSFARVLTETLTLTDIISSTKVFGRVLTETLTLTDSLGEFILDKIWGLGSILNLSANINKPTGVVRDDKGFASSKGEYVIFWDADVIAKPEMLEKMLNALKHHPEASTAEHIAAASQPAGLSAEGCIEAGTQPTAWRFQPR